MTELIKEINKVEFPSFSLSSLARSSSVYHVLTEISCYLCLAIGLIVIAFWLIFPPLSAHMMEKTWVFLSLQEAIIFSLLSTALLYYDHYPLLMKGRIAIWVSGTAVCVFVLIHPVITSSIKFIESPFTAMGLFGLSLAIVLSPGAIRGPRKLGDILGVTVLALITGFVYLFISYCYGYRVLFEHGIPCPFCYGTSLLLSGGVACPRLLAVMGTLILSGAVIGTLGPRHFPMRSFVGPSARSALLRRLMPVTISGILIFITVQGSMPKFISPPLTSFLTLSMSSLLVVYLVLRSSTVVSFQLEKALKDSEQRYSHLVEGLRDYAVLLLDSRGVILVWNPGAERITGYKAAEVTMEPFSLLFSKKGPEDKFDKAFAQLIQEGSFQMEGWAERKNGTSFWAETSLSKLMDGKGNMIGVSVIIRDATLRKKSEETMKASLLEKEVLLKEIHHRVKNNLQVISSLLRLQSEKARDEETAALFLDSQERVQAMAMVHEYLYKSPDLARVNFQAYVASLVRNLYRTFALSSSENSPHVEVDDVLLSLDMAVPCGLLLTELISNAMKYAYPDKKGGPIQVHFHKLAGGLIELSVADQGVGFPKNFDWTNSDSLGLRLIRLLTEQLQGQIRLEQDHGIKFVATFKENLGGGK